MAGRNPPRLRGGGSQVTGLLSRDLTLSEAGIGLLALMERTVNGRLTCAEALGHREFILTKLYRRA